MAVDEGERPYFSICDKIIVNKILFQATIELRYPMNSGANNAGNQLIQGKFKVSH